jgi:hypothetical protein
MPLAFVRGTFEGAGAVFSSSALRFLTIEKETTGRVKSVV